MSLLSKDGETASESLLVVSKGRRTLRGIYDGVKTRHVLALMGFLGFVDMATLRVNLSLALVAMVNHTAILTNNTPASGEECKAQSGNGTAEKMRDGPFVWNEYEQGIILGAFFYGFVVTQIPGGRLAERFGAKWLFGVAVLSTSLLTLLIPAAASWSVNAFVALRVVMGLGQGVTFPAMHCMIARWMPKDERSLLSTIIYSGMHIGTVVAMPISGLLCDSSFLGGWPATFYFFGLIGVVWFVFWVFLVYNTPQEHPRISEDERVYIEASQGQQQPRSEKPPVPWRAVLTSVPFWALMVAHLGFDWGFYTMFTEIPSYFRGILHFDIGKNGLVSALPYICGTAFGISSGFLADYVRRKGRFSISFIRKFFNSVSFFGAAACLFTLTLAECDKVLNVALLTLAMGFTTMCSAGFLVTHVDMSPDFAGTLMGMTNSFANLTGFLAPLTIGSLTNNNETIAQWSIVFYIAAGVYGVTGVIFLLFGSAELQPWGTHAQTCGVNPALAAPGSGNLLAGAPSTAGHDDRTAWSPTFDSTLPEQAD